VIFLTENVSDGRLVFRLMLSNKHLRLVLLLGFILFFKAVFRHNTVLLILCSRHFWPIMHMEVVVLALAVFNDLHKYPDFVRRNFAI